MTDQATVAGETKAIVAIAKRQGVILAAYTGLLWAIQVVNAAVGGRLVGLGIEPRSLEGLRGILFAPFIHGSFAHLIANTIPLVLLGWFVMLRRTRDFFGVALLSALVGGLGTWLIAPAASVHVGASVTVFGFLGYLLSRGIFERRFWSILGSLAVFVAFGGALWGVLPGAIGISWQGHLFGLLGGVLAARLLRAPGEETHASPPALRETAGVRVTPAAPARVASRARPDDEDIDAEVERLRARVRPR